MYLYRSGDQCPYPAMEGSDFCADHLPVPEPDTASSNSGRPLLVRLAALILLLIFLANYYQTLRHWLAN
ncbi:MAG: hypothetical protein HY649_01125 [Acidobacteria bacterium]|nr:hypothetical protein [Acidobacteriota bacterium]